MKKYSIAIHGGAGTILKKDMTPELELAYKEGLQQALDAGYAALDKGGTAIDAVSTAVALLEDNILFNAGKGSVFPFAGKHEMDAAIMEGHSRNAGAVAGISHIANPVLLALAVMQKSDHVFLAGKGAVEFAMEQGFELKPEDYFYSQQRYEQWLALKGSPEYALDHNVKAQIPLHTDKKFGTVGAVAVDQQGNLAAATSTGGMTNKKYGRIGDSPVIGSGTYANNATCAISCTGHGEPFIKAVAAYDVSCLMEYKGYSLQQSMEEVTLHKLVRMQGEGGMIGVDATGNIAMIFNSEGMYRAFKNSNGETALAIYKND